MLIAAAALRHILNRLNFFFSIFAQEVKKVKSCLQDFWSSHYHQDQTHLILSLVASTVHCARPPAAKGSNVLR